MKKIMILAFTLFPILCTSQVKKILIKGKVLDSLTVLKNINILNINTKKGTFSNDDGEFSIYVSKGDTLSFSSVQHQTKKIVVTEPILQLKEIEILLIPITYTLDEFSLKKHDLKGILSVDINKVPKNEKEARLKKNLDFSNINFYEKDVRIDENIRAMPPITIVDPNQKFQGGNLLKLFSSKKNKPYQPIIKKEFDESKVPDKLRIELGEDFFFKQLKIPKQHYQHFLEYCNLKKIQNLYQQNKLLTLIDFFQKQSILYLQKKN